MTKVKNDEEIRKELEKYYAKSDPSNMEIRIENTPIPGGIAVLKDFMKDNRVTDLVLRENELKQEEIVDLVNSDPMGSVTYLHLTKQGITDNTLDAIVNSPHLKNLEQLGLRGNNDITSVFSVLTKDPTKLPNLKLVDTPDREGLEAVSIHEFLKAREILHEAVIDNKKENIKIAKKDMPILIAALQREKSQENSSKPLFDSIALLLDGLKNSQEEDIKIPKIMAEKLVTAIIQLEAQTENRVVSGVIEDLMVRSAKKSPEDNIEIPTREAKALLKHVIGSQEYNKMHTDLKKIISQKQEKLTKQAPTKPKLVPKPPVKGVSR
ncbi:hypothetical protein [Candidatus Tisiphia endosymbiont of Nemotelus uliginosus]|uniref:hypothetical protein n=1 Tax=Candidatus Tisiphia endosymbiont of Nemotelus uliginosus TaxID=3077926 RepID=UPI0035C89E46